MRGTLIVIGVLATIGLTSAHGYAAKRDASDLGAQDRAAKRACLNGDANNEAGCAALRADRMA